MSSVPVLDPQMTNPTFAQAQQRLAERRRAREAQARIQHDAETSASHLRSRISSHPSPLLRSLGGAALSAWDAASSREGTRPAFRVGQVDAELLDEELVQLLRGQAGEALRYLGGLGANLQDEWSAEIALALRAALFKLTVWDHDATYGAALQNLRYTDARSGGGGGGAVPAPPTRWQKGLYGLVTVGGRYAWTRLEGWLLSQDDGLDAPGRRAQVVSRLASAAESAHAAAALASFLVFLLHGRYRTLLDRVLRMRLAPPTSQVSREVSFEYLNRQLVWHAFTEFLLFVLPLIGINRWRRWLGRAWRRTRGAVSGGGGGAEAEDKEKKGELSFLPERTCAICYQDQNSASTEQEVLAAAASSGVVGSAQTDITNPYETIPCGCVYCFVCLATRIEGEEGDGWACLRCGELARECRPWGGDVLEPARGRSEEWSSSSPPPTAAAGPTAKAVMFADDVKGAPPTETESSSQADFVDAVEDMSESASTVRADSGGDGGSENDDSEEYDEEESELGDDYV